MTTHDDFDSQLRDRLHSVAPRGAPPTLLEETMNRLADTPQRAHGGWLLGSTGGRLLAAVAVLLIAVVAGTQIVGLVDRRTGTSESPGPSVTPTANPSASATPSDTVAPTATPEPSARLGAPDELVLRITLTGGGPLSPTDLLPWVSLMADGTLIWQPVPPEAETASLLTRRLTPEGLAELREVIFGSGLLDENATHELEALPGVVPPGQGVGTFTFTTGESNGGVIVRSHQWLGDETEETYYQPSEERKGLDAMAFALRDDPESLLDEDAWEGPSEPYEAADYQLVLEPVPDSPPYGNPDMSELPLAYDGPIEEFGEGTESPGERRARCGVITREEAAGIVEVFDAGDFGEVGTDRVTSGGLDWAEGNGTVDVALLPRMPDGFPECADQL